MFAIPPHTWLKKTSLLISGIAKIRIKVSVILSHQTALAFKTGSAITLMRTA